MSYINKLEHYCHSLEDKVEDLKARCEAMNKAINRACKVIDDITGSCPLGQFDYYNDCENCENRYRACWKEWLLEDDK